MATGDPTGKDFKNTEEVKYVSNITVNGETYQLKADIADNGVQRNMLYEETNLGTWESVADVEKFIADNNVSTGTFGKLKLGNYVTIKDGTYNKVWMIAGFDVHIGMGDTSLTKHHVAMVPRTNLMSAKMNETNITTGGYKGSLMFTETMPVVVENLEKVLGDHMLEHCRLLSKAVNTSAASGAYAGWMGAASDWEWTSVKACLLTEPQVYGGRVGSSSRYDVGEGWQQLPVFKFVTPNKFAREWWWLRAVAGSSSFCSVHSNGVAYHYAASYSLGVRPLILVG